ncbi:MAG: hypothetical protein BYD32DRAFT_96416 [Podila humilis]|nr:MAG: hypothetical protein BYD32DRAFT_96416 [Podila humilis]
MLSLSSFPFFSLQLFIIVLYISIHLDCSGASIAVRERHPDWDQLESSQTNAVKLATTQWTFIKTRRSSSKAV